MSRKRLTRRAFLKLAAAAPLAASPFFHPVSGLRIAPDGGTLPPETRAASGPPNLLVIVFDAMSARNLSLYGYSRLTTPLLESLSRGADVYHQHHAAGTFTSPGTASLLTGVYPWSHRALHMRARMTPAYAADNLFGRLPAAYHKFAYTQNPLAFALLQQAGDHLHTLASLHTRARYANTFSEALLYQDYYLASEAETLLLKEEYDPPASLFASLVDKLRTYQQNAALLRRHRRDYPRGLINCRPTNPGTFCFTLEDAVDWTVKQVKESPEPFAGYVHFFPPHAPYNPRAEFIDRFDDSFKPPTKPEFSGEATHNLRTLTRYRRFYDQSIAHVDAEFARLMSSLQAAGKLENTVVVLTSDHGEMLERGVWGHISSAMYEPLIHIPLLIFNPGQAARRDIHSPTSNVDLVPTLLQLAGADSTGGEGQPLPTSDPSTGQTGRSLFVLDAKTNPKMGALRKTSSAVLRWPMKIIRYSGQDQVPDGYELYDLDDDPEELKDVYAPDSGIAGSLIEELEDRIRTH